jgi:hypothetical protein
LKSAIFILALCATLSAQNPERIGMVVDVIRAPQSLTISGLNGKGISFTASQHIADIGTGNPASVALFNQLTAGISFQLETKQKGPESFNYDIKRNNSWLPQSVGIMYPLDKFRFAVALNRKYSTRIEFEKVAITSPEMMDGTGEFFKPVFETSITSYSAIAGYRFDRLLSSNQLTLAFRLNLDHLSNEEQVIITGRASGFSSSWAVGILADFELQPKISLEFGASYEKDVDIEETQTYESDGFLVQDPDTSGEIITDLPPSTLILAQIPGRLNFGAALKFTDLLTIDASFSQLYWSDISTSLNDIFEYTVSLNGVLTNGLGISAGILGTGLTYSSEPFSGADDLDALYLILGTRIEVQPIQIDLVVADNHLDSGKRREQTIIKAAVTYVF